MGHTERDWGVAPERAAGSHPATHLVRELAGLGRELERVMGERLTVNDTDLRAMSVLLARGSMTVSDLATALELGVPATSMAVGRLEKLGHVTRERGATDRRRVTIRATPSSAARARDALLPMIRDVDAVLDEVPDTERAAVQRYLQAVTETMRRHLEVLGR